MKESSLVAWNGLQLRIPGDWDMHVGGLRHLIFEKDFQPQAQIRWETADPGLARHNDSRLTKAISQIGPILTELPPEWFHLSKKFNNVRGYCNAGGRPGGLYCLSPQGHIIILVQLLSEDQTVRERIGNCLAALSCQPSGHVLWRIQDFSLVTPSSFVLSNYTFAAGLTRLSFCLADPFLHTCRIVPVDDRVRSQSLKELLFSLAGTDELEISSSTDNVCHGWRNPSMARQVLFRIRRQKPFLRARIWRDQRNNRLLAVVLASNNPIREETAEIICEKYEIIS